MGLTPYDKTLLIYKVVNVQIYQVTIKDKNRQLSRKVKDFL